MAYTPMGRTLAAGAEVFERITRRFGKPAFDLPTCKIGKETVKITEEFIVEKPFCNLLLLLV
jgi:poly(3-hydroxybutyrate) depolymerase